MLTTASTKRYAQAIFQIALERDQLERWLEDLATLAGATAHVEFSQLLDSPQIPDRQTLEVIQDVLGSSVGPLAINLMAILASRNIAHIVPEIAEQYQRLLDAHRGIERAEIVSAVPLEEERLRQIADMLGRLVSKDIRLTSRVEPRLIGGLVARVGDRVIDGSIRAKLQTMRGELVEQLR